MANKLLLIVLIVGAVLLLNGGLTGNLAYRLPYYKAPTYDTSTTTTYRAPTDTSTTTTVPQVTTQTQCPSAPTTNQQLNTLLAQLSTTQRMIVSMQKNMMPQLAEGEGGTLGGPFCGHVDRNGLVMCGIQCKGTADCKDHTSDNCGYFNCANK